MSKKQTEAHKNGSGYILLDFDEKTKTVNLDVSGNDGDFGSFRNDASILWTVAQSYMTSCKVLLKPIENSFENSDRYLVTNLIIPYYFIYPLNPNTVKVNVINPVIIAATIYPQI